MSSEKENVSLLYEKYQICVLPFQNEFSTTRKLATKRSYVSRLDDVIFLGGVSPLLD